MEILLAIAGFASFAGLVLAACVIPAPFEPERASDGGPPASPNITSITPDFPAITLITNDEQEFSAQMEDANGDPLTVRFFRDWPTVPQSLSSLAATPITGGAGTVKKYETSLRFRPCAGVTAGEHRIDIVVSDRGFKSIEQDPTFREPLENGLVAVRSWLVTCEP